VTGHRGKTIRFITMVGEFRLADLFCVAVLNK